MDKKILLLIFLVILIAPLMVFAQLHGYDLNGNSTTSSIVSFQNLVPDIEDATAMIFGAVAVVMFVIAGIYFLTAGGEPEKLQKARSSFMWGVAGVVVGIIAFSIIAIVGSLL